VKLVKLKLQKINVGAFMEKFGKSQSVLRTEDNRFLTGKGNYIDDSTPAGSLFAFFIRRLSILPLPAPNEM